MNDRRRLLDLLSIAESKLRAIGEKPVWSSYESAIAMADFIADVSSKIQNETLTQTEKAELWGIFAPTCDWDDVVGDPKLGNDIFSILNSNVD